MIRYIKLKNYRTFTNLNIDFSSKNNTPLHLVILYGANASGKSALISVFETLSDTMQTLNVQNAILNYLANNSKKDNMQEIHASIRNKAGIKNIIQNNKTIGSAENMVIEIGFQCNNKNGSYLIEFDNEQIVREKLEFTLEKNRGVMFSISPKIKRVNSRIFGELKADISTQIMRFWGRHSMLSILISSLDTYSEQYFENNISSSLLEVIDYFNSICVFLTSYKTQRGIITYDLSPNQYASGQIALSEQYKLDNIEKALNIYFTGLYSDIREVFYKRETNASMINYQLYFKKIISGLERDIPYYEESCGTQNLMYIMPYLVSAVHGGIVAIDEIDNGIHDVLLQKLLKKICQNLSGQIILTTHNILLMEEYDFKDSFYFIDIDETGTRNIITPAQSNYRIQRESNVILNYLKGRFKGLPWENIDIDLSKIDLK